MKKVIVFLPKGQIEFTTDLSIGEIASYVYERWQDNNGFKVEDLEMVRSLRR